VFLLAHEADSAPLATQEQKLLKILSGIVGSTIMTVVIEKAGLTCSMSATD
jgi:hypothetical protein